MSNLLKTEETKFPLSKSSEMFWELFESANLSPDARRWHDDDKLTYFRTYERLSKLLLLLQNNADTFEYNGFEKFPDIFNNHETPLYFDENLWEMYEHALNSPAADNWDSETRLSVYQSTKALSEFLKQIQTNAN